MSINLTDEIEVKTKKGKLGAAKQIFLEGDTQTVEKEIQDINSRHSDLNTKYESLSRTVQGIAATGGASTATNVTYNNDASGLNAENVQDAIDELKSSKTITIAQELGEAEDKVMSQKAIKTELDKKIDKANIAHETGEAEDRVMSQKAVSDKISNLLSNISEISEIANTASTNSSNALTQAEAANKTAEENKSSLNTIIPDISTLKEKVDSIPANIPKFVSMTEVAYEALEVKESDTYYMLTEE